MRNSHVWEDPCVRNKRTVESYRIAEAAELLGVSDDTVRRWIEAGKLATVDDSGPSAIAGPDLARLVESQARRPAASRSSSVSARNRLTGIVTKVVKDTVMAQVEVICGPYRMVSLMSAEAATELGLEPGVRAIVSVKSTNVVVERP
jgi:molybdopterin-binding protein